MDSTIKAGLAGAVCAIVVIGAYSTLASTSPVQVSTMRVEGRAQLASVVSAESTHSAPHLDFGPNLDASNCNGNGAPVINVVEGIKNDEDSGIAGNYWGLDAINRTIQVWKTSTPGTYCATVKYTGSFQGVAGQTSPGATGTLTGKESGPITGGYTAKIVGTLLTSPTWATKGNVGTFDYQCNVITADCPGYVSWSDQYFAPGYSFDQPWWGWTYRSGGGKVWINAISGNSGDII